MAKKEGYEYVAAIFQETADHERSHAKQFFRFLKGGMVEITASYQAGVIGTTIENLKAAASVENEEWTKLYPMFADIAKEEGFPEVSATFKIIAKIEQEHERRYLKLLKNLEEGTFFKKSGKVFWKCRVCGYVYEAEQALEICPACKHPRAFMQLMEENY